jgi:hypothetical protein
MDSGKKRGRPRQWRDTGAPGYQAHNDGRIRHGKKELVPYKMGGHLFVKVRGMELPVDELVALSAGNKPESPQWSRLVHIDGDPLNCSADNLRWVHDDFEELKWLMQQPPVSNPSRIQRLG